MPNTKQLEETIARILSRRMHTQEELRRKLQQKGYASSEIDRALNHAVSVGWLNDYEAGKQLACEQLRHGGYGRQRLEAKLRERGVHPKVIQMILEELWGSQVESDQAAKALKRWLSSHSAKNLANNRPAAAYQALLRRGFDPEISSQLCRELTEDSERYDVDIGSS